MENIEGISLSWLVVSTRDYKKEYAWIWDKIHHCCYGLLKSEITNDMRVDLVRQYVKISDDVEYYEGCILMPELQELDIYSAAEVLREWCNKNQIHYKEDLDEYKRVEAGYWGHGDVV